MVNMGNKTIYLAWLIGMGGCVWQNPSNLQMFSLVSFSTIYGWSKLNETDVVGDLS